MADLYHAFGAALGPVHEIPHGVRNDPGGHVVLPTDRSGAELGALGVDGHPQAVRRDLADVAEVEAADLAAIVGAMPRREGGVEADDELAVRPVVDEIDVVVFPDFEGRSGVEVRLRQLYVGAQAEALPRGVEDGEDGSRLHHDDVGGVGVGILLFEDAVVPDEHVHHAGKEPGIGVGQVVLYQFLQHALLLTRAGKS